MKKDVSWRGRSRAWAGFSLFALSALIGVGFQNCARVDSQEGGPQASDSSLAAALAMKAPATSAAAAPAESKPPAIVVTNAGLGCANNECVWARAAGARPGCKVYVWSEGDSVSQIETIASPVCRADGVFFEIPKPRLLLKRFVVFQAVNPGGQASAPRAVGIHPTQRFGYSDSGSSYSGLVGMFDRRAASSAAGSWAWSSNQNDAQVSWSGPDQLTERFRREGGWITLSGWGAVQANGSWRNYQIYTTKAVLMMSDRNYDLTAEFLGRGHPYALESLPTSDYRLYVEGTLIEYVDDAPTGNRLPFSWHVFWGRPELRDTLNFGKRLGILQSEHWIDPANGESRQVQVVCQGIGYACWRQGHKAAPDGVEKFWTW